MLGAVVFFKHGGYPVEHLPRWRKGGQAGSWNQRMNRMQPIIRLMSHLFLLPHSLRPLHSCGDPLHSQDRNTARLFFFRPLCIAASSKLAVCSFSGSLTNLPHSISSAASNQQQLLQHISITIIFRLPPVFIIVKPATPPQLPTYLPTAQCCTPPSSSYLKSPTVSPLGQPPQPRCHYLCPLLVCALGDQSKKKSQ